MKKNISIDSRVNRLCCTVFITIVIHSILGCVSEQVASQKSSETHSSKRPNVIVVITDDQGYGDMSVHGNPYVNTPAIDKLANDGVRLNDFHVDPTCSPSRAALMTGRYATRVGVWLTYAGRNHLYREETTMADVFKHNGYRTAIFGKWHLGDNYPFRPQDRGFDYSFIHAGGVVGEAPDYWENDYFDDVYLENGNPKKVTGYSGDQWFDKTIEYIDQDPDTPFFVYLATNTPHGPFNVAPEYSAPYLEQGIPETRSRFYGMIANIDDNIQRLRSHLSSNGLERDTLILYMTDNGSTEGVQLNPQGYAYKGFNAGMRGKKTSAYEGGHRAASFIYWPEGGIEGGTVIDQLTAHIDILPTFIDLLKLRLPKTGSIAFDGVSLANIITDSKSTLPTRDLVVHNQARFGEPSREGELIYQKDFAVMRDKWRLVGKALFDLKTDPSQRDNIAELHPQMVAKMQQFYEHWWRDVSAETRHSPVVINPLYQQETKLTGQAWYGTGTPYDQQHVRGAMEAQGYFLIDVEKPGEYMFDVRRWPKESNLTFGDLPAKKRPNPGLDPDFKLYQIEDKAIDVRSVLFTLDGEEAKQNIEPTQQSAMFSRHLSKGRHKVSADMIDKQGQIFGAYYLYIQSN